MSGTSIWEAFEHDPRRAETAHLRASDRDRAVVDDVLGSAYAEGRLTREELDERTDLVRRARTLAHLPPLVGDLVSVRVSGKLAPTERRSEAERIYRQRRQSALFSFLTPTLICWIVWVSVLAAGHGTGFPWPAFVTIGTGMPFLRLATNREDHVASIEQSLAKKELRQVRREQRRQLPPPPDPSLGA